MVAITEALCKQSLNMFLIFVNLDSDSFLDKAKSTAGARRRLQLNKQKSLSISSQNNL